MSALFLAQRLERIDFCHPARWHVTSEHRQRRQQQWRADEQSRIAHTNLQRVNKNIGQRRKYFGHRERAQKSENRSDAYQSRAFAQHQRQRLPLTRAQRHANSYLLAPLRDRVRRDPGDSDCGQHQAEHSNAAVCTDCEPRAGPAEIQVVAKRSHIEDGQVRIDMSDLAPNAAKRIRSRIHSCIRPRHNGHAIGWGPRKIAPRQRYINYGSTDPDVIPHVADHADYFIGLLVVPKELPYRISISEKSSRGALVQYGG